MSDLCKRIPSTNEQKELQGTSLIVSYQMANSEPISQANKPGDLLPDFSETSISASGNQDKEHCIGTPIEEQSKRQLDRNNSLPNPNMITNNSLPPDLKHNLSQQKVTEDITEDLSLSRKIAAFLRRKRVLRAENTDIAKLQLKQLYNFIEELLPKYTISKFKLRTKQDSNKQTFEKSSEKVHLLMESLEEENIHKTDQLEIGVIDQQMLEHTNNYSQDTPSTPPSNRKAREELQRRLEETPFSRTTVEVPDYVYNSDDDFLMRLIERKQWQS